MRDAAMAVRANGSLDRFLPMHDELQSACGGTAMNLKLEELRRRLLEPGGNGQSPVNSVYKRSTAEMYAANQAVSEAKSGDWVMSEESAGADREPAKYEQLIAPPVAGEPAAAESAASSIREAVVRYAEKAAGASETNGAAGGDNQYQVAQAVAKAFEPIKSFQERIFDLMRAFESIEGLGQSALKSFAPLATFRDQIAKLARMFEPMRVFQTQLAELAQSMEAMRGLQYQLSLLSDAFAVNLRQTASSIQPAIDFRAMLLKLAMSFESASELQASFNELAALFQSAPAALEAAGGSTKSDT